jgi:signal transduction histidine kinase
MIVLACALGFFVAGGLSRPVLWAADWARRISKGEYEGSRTQESQTQGSWAQMKSAKPSGIREMDALSESVAELGRSLAGQESLRKRLMIDIAHELRTPLTVVKSQLEAFADGVWDTSPERLNTCVMEIDRLSELVSEVEHLSNLEGEILILQTEPTELGPWLENILTSFARLFSEAGIALTWQLPEKITADIDASRFRHVIENLLSNALRYTVTGQKVEVRLGKEGSDIGSGSVKIEIEDTGVGIKPADLPHVFDRFYRADNARAHRIGGRGVGLAIAKAAVEAHGGAISVKSEDGQGSLFTIVLPSK